MSPSRRLLRSLAFAALITVAATSGAALASGIGDFVWRDFDCDGVQDPGEFGVEEVRVDLFTCARVLQASTETDYSGFYSFKNLAPGCYRVRFVAPTGYTFSPKDAA